MRPAPYDRSTLPVADDRSSTIGSSFHVRLVAAFVLLLIVQIIVVVDSNPVGSREKANSPDEADAGSDGVQEGISAAVSASAPRVGSRISARRLEVELDGNELRFGPPSAIGDVDGDGVTDLAVGAYSDDRAGKDAGSIHILFMNADGAVRSRQRISTGAGGFGGDVLADASFGFRTAGIGDLDGDGVPDLAVSAYRSDRAGDDAGEVWILFLTPEGKVRTWQVITTGFGGFESELAPGDQFGVDVAAIGDVDGDGVRDLAVGSWRADRSTVDDGAVYVLRLDRDGTVKRSTEISSAGGWPVALVPGAGLGVSIDGVGDLDGNGVNDLAIGAIDAVAARGGLHIALMEADGVVGRVTTMEPDGSVLPVPAEGDRLGATVAGLGDVDGDGLREVAVGAVGVNNFTGAVWIVSLDEQGAAVLSTRLDVEGLEPGDLFGHTVAALGDITGDGSVDLAVGAPGDDEAGEDHGALYLVEFEAQIDNGPGGDLDGDGLRNGLEGDEDVDGDGLSNALDLDSDGDGVLDELEGPRRDSDDDELVNRIDSDDDGDGIETVVEGRADPDVDGIPNYLDGDSDGDDIADSEEGARDRDGDGEPNFVDLDSDGDGALDSVEGDVDTDGDGRPDFVDLDSDGDDVPDDEERRGDDDGDGIPDRVDETDDTDADPDDDDTATDDAGADGGDTGGDADGGGDTSDDGGAGVDDADDGGVNDGGATEDDGDTATQTDESDDTPEDPSDTGDDGSETAEDPVGREDETAETGDGGGDVDEEAAAPRAQVEVEVAATGDIIAGAMNDFELKVSNRGPDAASSAVATMMLPVGVEIDATDLPAGCSLAGRELTCRFGALGVDESASLTIRAAVMTGVEDVEFEASVKAPEGAGLASTGPIAVIDGGLTRAAEGLGTTRGALIAVSIVALLCGGAILTLTRDRNRQDA